MADDRITAIFKRAKPDIFDIGAAAGRARSGKVSFGEAFDRSRLLKMQEAKTIGDLFAQQQGLGLQEERVGMERERLGLAREQMDWQRIKLEAEQQAAAGDKEAKIFSDSLAPFTEGLSTQATAALYEAAAREFAEAQPQTVQEGNRIAANIVGSLGLQQKPKERTSLTLAERKELETHKASLKEKGGGTKEQRNRESLRLQYPSLSERQIDDIIFNRVSISSPDDFGNIYLVNKVTGTKDLITPEVKPATAAPSVTPLAEAKTEKPVAETVTPLETHAERGGGPYAAMGQMIGIIAEGFFGAEDVFSDTAESRAALEFFERTVQDAVVKNPRFPVAEQQRVQGMLPSASRFFTSRQRERNRASELRSWLINTRTSNEEALERGGISTDRQVTLKDQISAIDQVLSLMGIAPGQGSSPDNPIRVNTPGEAKDLPAGTYIVTPDGRRMRTKGAK